MLGLTLSSLLVVATAQAGAPAGEPCTITVAELPVAARSYHHLEIEGGRMQLGGEALVLHLVVEHVTVRLVGPRYTGTLQVALADCVDGRVLELRARPRPATLRFVAAPVDLVLRCVRCPRGILERWTLAREVRPIRVGHGATLDVELRAPGHHPARRSFLVLPGENEIEVALEAW